MPLNPYFPTKGTPGETGLVEDLIIESIKDYGCEFYYIPRSLVAKDDVLGEDNLSEFKNSYMIEAYFDNVDNFGGRGQFMSKFGLNIEEQAQITVARKRWDQLVGQYGTTILPNRPCEGDLLWFPLTNGLFEIRFVDHQNQFYQLGKLYVFKLKIELFQFNSETMETGITEVDTLALEKTFDILSQRIMQEDGTGAVEREEEIFPIIEERDKPVDRDYRRNETIKDESKSALDFDESNPFADFDA
jgi:hypothetical protein